MKTIKAWVETKKGNQFEILLPAKRVVCPSCEGDGTELCGGLNGVAISDENLADPDFRRSYFGGDYDVACSHCGGLRVVDVVDEEQLDQKMRDRYLRAVDSAHRADLETYYEQRRFGGRE